MPATETEWPADWPGREFGIRQPYPGETPLSWPEVFVALRDVLPVGAFGVGQGLDGVGVMQPKKFGASA